MDVVLSAVKTDLNNVLNTGRYMLASFFVLAVFFNYVGIMSRNVNWAEVILRLVIGLILLQNYVWIMDTTRNIVVSVDEMINPNQDVISQYAAMNDNFHKQQQETTRPSIIAQVKYVFLLAPMHNIIINLSFLFYALIAKVMEAVRYSLIAVLYKMGPALIPFVLFQSTGTIIKGWFSSYISVLCWPILWHIILGIAVALSASTNSIEQFACINFAVCFVLVFSPLIINGLIAGIGASSTSVLAGFMSSKSAASFMTAAGQVGVAVAASRVVGPLIQRLPGSPTTATGKFKDLMLGDKGKGVKP